MASIVRPDSLANIGGPAAWPTSRPDSVASIVRPDSVANIGGPAAWPTSRPGSVASIVRPDSAANIGGPAAWPTSRPASRVADMRPVQAEAERKHAIEDSEARELRGRLPRPASCVADIKARQLRGRHKCAGAEVEEARAGRALSAPTTQHPRRRSRTANKPTSLKEARVTAKAACAHHRVNFCFKRTSLPA